MDQKSSGSSFTQAELRDLFTLDETTDCQTHDLLGCDCEGKGYLVDVASSTLKNRGCKPDAEAGESPDKCQSKDGDDDNDDSYDDDGLPIFPGLMKASKVDVEKIEMVCARFLFCYINCLCFLLFMSSRVDVPLVEHIQLHVTIRYCSGLQTVVFPNPSPSYGLGLAKGERRPN